MRISVIIPVHNDADNLAFCLKAIANSTPTPDEIIVVNDASSDRTADVIRENEVHSAALMPPAHGPAFARNYGVTLATGDLLVFLDADTSPYPDTFAKIIDEFLNNPDISALFGSYDDKPSQNGLISQFKNLQHHFVHQNGKKEASTFWAGCGAIRTDVFRSMGGFNESYSRPSIEDIELGYRLRRSGHKIRLCPGIQVTHHKKWTFRSWLHSDIICRAIPWTRLISGTRQMPGDLNVSVNQRVSAMLAWTEIIILGSGLYRPWIWYGLILAVPLRIEINKDFYLFFKKKKGITFSLFAYYLHGLYLLYSSLVFALFGGFNSIFHKNPK